MRRLFLILLSVATICACQGHKEQTISIENQRIDLPGVANARQFGGYSIGDKTVKKDVLLRSGNLSLASDEAVKSLEDRYRLAMVFDFRSSIEHDSAPDRNVNGCTEVWLPCLEDIIAKTAGSIKKSHGASGDVKAMAESMLKGAKDTLMAKMANAMYDMLAFDTKNQKSYITFLDSLAVLPEGRAALWHCSQGKDRCGFGSAMVLAALGADKDLIIKDFAMSNESYREILDTIITKARQMNYSDSEINTIYSMVGVSVENFSNMLERIETRYGSLDNYLTTVLECPAEQKAQLRARFLE